jgi:hypothetical protein
MNWTKAKHIALVTAGLLSTFAGVVYQSQLAENQVGAGITIGVLAGLIPILWARCQVIFGLPSQEDITKIQRLFHAAAAIAGIVMPVVVLFHSKFNPESQAFIVSGYLSTFMGDLVKAGATAVVVSVVPSETTKRRIPPTTVLVFLVAEGFLSARAARADEPAPSDLATVPSEQVPAAVAPSVPAAPTATVAAPAPTVPVLTVAVPAPTAPASAVPSDPVPTAAPVVPAAREAQVPDTAGSTAIAPNDVSPPLSHCIGRTFHCFFPDVLVITASYDLAKLVWGRAGVNTVAAGYVLVFASDRMWGSGIGLHATGQWGQGEPSYFALVPTVVVFKHFQAGVSLALMDGKIGKDFVVGVAADAELVSSFFTGKSMTAKLDAVQVASRERHDREVALEEEGRKKPTSRSPSGAQLAWFWPARALDALCAERGICF